MQQKGSGTSCYWKTVAVFPCFLSEAFIWELMLHMVNGKVTWHLAQNSVSFSHRLCKGTLQWYPNKHWKPEIELQILTSGKFTGNRIKWDRSKVLYLRNTDVHCSWLTRLQFPLWRFFFMPIATSDSIILILCLCATFVGFRLFFQFGYD